MIERLARWAALGDHALDRLRARARGEGVAGRWRIVPYDGYGDAQRWHVGARVLRDAGHAAPAASHGVVRNMIEFWKRMESDEYPGARVRVGDGTTAVETVADGEGHVRATLELPAPSAPGWQAVDFVLLHPAGGAPLAGARGEALVPAPDACCGVISDVDDTVVWSDVTRKVRMLALLATSNAHTREPLPGAAALYRALADGPGDARNPVFYVSGGPWNLYEPLVEFLRVRGFPRGPLFLKDFGDHTLFAASDHRTHKRRAIARILGACPGLAFVLLGDSGERDPEIYAEAAREHPGRVLAIYVRCVGARPARVRAIRALADASPVPFVLASDSVAIARHAASIGLLADAAVAGVAAPGAPALPGA